MIAVESRTLRLLLIPTRSRARRTMWGRSQISAILFPCAAMAFQQRRSIPACTNFAPFPPKRRRSRAAIGSGGKKAAHFDGGKRRVRSAHDSKYNFTNQGARDITSPDVKMGNRSLFPVVAVPLAFFCTRFFEHTPLGKGKRRQARIQNSSGFRQGGSRRLHP